MFRSGTWYLSDSNIGSRVSHRFSFGNATDQPLSGHWFGGRIDSVGVGRWS